MSMDSWLSIMFVAWLMLGGIGGICVACTLVGRNMRRKRHDDIVSSKSLEKKKRIKKKYNILRKLFAGLEGDLLKLACDFMQNAAFMAVTMEVLQETINEKGATEEYCNGENQRGIKKSSEVDVYNRQLADMLPKEETGNVKADEYDTFVKAR